MFNNISWSEYLSFISVSALIWYSFVLYNYFRHDLFQLHQGKGSNKLKSLQLTAELPQHYQHNVLQVNSENYKPTATDISQIVQSFTGEVQAYLEEAAQNEDARENLLKCLTIIVSKYPSLVDSEFKNSLTQFIINQTEANCAMVLSEDDLRQIWNEA